MAEIKLGDRARDVVTGFEGVAVARTQWLNGCVRISLQPEKLDKEGKVRESQSFDVEQLEVVGKPVKIPGRNTGGPRPEPARRPDVSGR